jgi:Sec-independent protein translocase protein TatA
MPVSLQYPTLGKNLGKTLKKLAKTWENRKTVKKLAETKKTLEKPAKTLENQKKIQKTLENQKNKKKQKKTIFLDSLEGGVPAKPQGKLFVFLFVFFWVFWFFWLFQCFFGFFGFPRFLQVVPRFFWFWSLSAICIFFYTCRSMSSCVQACRNQSFNHCSYEHTGSEDQDCVFQF